MNSRIPPLREPSQPPTNRGGIVGRHLNEDELVNAEL